MSFVINLSEEIERIELEIKDLKLKLCLERKQLNFFKQLRAEIEAKNKEVSNDREENPVR